MKNAINARFVPEKLNEKLRHYICVSNMNVLLMF